MCHSQHVACHRRRCHFTDWDDLNASFCWRLQMTGLGMDRFFLWGLSGWLSILVLGALGVPTTVEMQTMLTTAFEDFSEVSQGVASPGRSSHVLTISGTKPTERLLSSASSPSLVTKKYPNPFSIQNHSGTPGFGITRTFLNSSDPTFISASRSLISTPAQPTEPLKPSIQSPLVPIQSQKTPREMSSTGNLDLSSLSSTLDPLATPRTSSITGSKRNSTPNFIQNSNPSPGFGTTGTPAPTGSLRLLDQSATRIPISSPETFKPSSSSSAPDSTPVPIQDHNIPSGFGTTGNTLLTSNATLISSISTPETPEPLRTKIQSTLVPIQSHESPAITSLTNNSNLTSLTPIPEPAETTSSSNITESTSVVILSHSGPPGFRTTQKTFFTGNTDLTRPISTREPLDPPNSSPVTSQSSSEVFETTIRTDPELTSQSLSATRNSSSSSATPTTGTSSTTRTAAPCATAKTPPITENQSCSRHGVVKPCLIAIVCLAALATIFMVSTIVLCAKLSTKKYKVRKTQDLTEMTFMSTLMPERNYAGIRRHSPVSNGVLVIHSSGDSDEDISDNLTLSSFLPESDRCV
ncbi:P-selectin glycoprotein ligand 1 [Hippocampus zosterae]|uniref:P-selectin glycoprotein ligand 1 n=1 Tax=Hippocampus zosterae TaxID=109293 RepID=UPI00223E582C|nr:P-selectin glycoprotein ligand 1 [Hippocampus zosterae]